MAAAPSFGRIAIGSGAPRDDGWGDGALELQQAYARIAELERDLVTRPADVTQRRITDRLKYFFFLVGFAIITVIGSIAVGRATRRVPTVTLPAAPPEPMPVAGALQLVRGRGPLLVDRDGRRDLVMLGWRGDSPHAALYVVGIDRATYEVRWRSGPYRSAYRDKRVHLNPGERGEVVLTDGLGWTHVIDGRSGLTKYKRAPADDATNEAKAPLRWPRSLVPPGQREWPNPSVTPNDWTTLASGRVLHVYQSSAGPYRMSAHETKAERLEYDVELPLGSFVDALDADGDEVLLVSRGSLFVLDAKTGAVARRIARF